MLIGILERLEEVDEDRQVAALCTISAQLVDNSNPIRSVESNGNERVSVEQRDVGGCGERLATAVRAPSIGSSPTWSSSSARGSTARRSVGSLARRTAQLRYAGGTQHGFLAPGQAAPGPRTHLG